MDTYFIGYDAREKEAAAVAAFSIQRRTNRRSRIYILEHRALRRLGLFRRPWIIGATGQFYDQTDERPFSTEFSHSRFLAFYLARALKCTGPCMFVDCDWLFLSDPALLMRQQEEHPNQIGVVMRDREVQDGSTKMDGMVQSAYGRKLWSALFTFMPEAEFERDFTPDAINHKDGTTLHQFLHFTEDRFWPIDPSWHHIPSLDPDPETYPRATHFSEFSPWLNPDHYSQAPREFAEWESEHREWLRYAAMQGKTEVWRDLETDMLGAEA